MSVVFLLCIQCELFYYFKLYVALCWLLCFFCCCWCSFDLVTFSFRSIVQLLVFASSIESNNLLLNWFIMSHWYRMSSSIWKKKIIATRMNPQLNIQWLGSFFVLVFVFPLGFWWKKIFSSEEKFLISTMQPTTAIVLNTVFDIKSNIWTHTGNDVRHTERERVRWKKRKQATTVFAWNIKGTHLILCRFIFAHNRLCDVCVCVLCMFSSFGVQFFFHVFCVMCTFVCLIHHYFAIFKKKEEKKQKIIRSLCDPHNLWIKTYGFFPCYRLICVFVCLFPSKYTWNTNEITKKNSNSMSLSNPQSESNDDDGDANISNLYGT